MTWEGLSGTELERISRESLCVPRQGTVSGLPRFMN